MTVIIPWQSGCPHRAAALEWVRPRWEASGAQVLLGKLGANQLWCKAAAVAAALPRAHGEVLVIADADVWTEGTGRAVEAVADGAPWAVPHWHVHRLTEQATARVFAGGPLEGTLSESVHRRLDRPAYVGYAAGGVTVLPRATYTQVPLDRRFVGWGQEDESWAHALTTLAGSCWRGQADLWHLWHPPQARLNPRWGTSSGRALARSYEQARRLPEQMRALLEGAPDS